MNLDADGTVVCSPRSAYIPLLLAVSSLPECAAKSHANALTFAGTRAAPSFLAWCLKCIVRVCLTGSGVCMSGYGIAAFTNTHDACIRSTHLLSYTGAKYHLKDVKTAMKEAMMGGSQGKILLER